ncbi:unnamed protein product, partial [Tetraodon nigroviridis]
CPFYKKIPGTKFVVDAFRYGKIEGITTYFLTHFHSDHYGGLTKNSTLPVYCNKITGNLVRSKLKVAEQYIHVLPMNTQVAVDGVTVVLLDANHYCSPEYTFPTQQEVINFAASTAFEEVALNPRTIVVCGSYSVGKEKVFFELSISFSSDSQKLEQHLARFSSQYDQLVAFKPTGWTFSQQVESVGDVQPDVSGNISIYGIPYSEHSSFMELKRFVQWLQPLKIIPTVNNGSWVGRKAMEKVFGEWLMEA